LTLPYPIFYLGVVGVRIIAIALFVCTALLSNCGTTHQFFPAAPLEKKQGQVTLNFHVDLGRPILMSLSPEWSFFYGIDQTTNVGIGFQFPIFFSQATVAHYEPTGLSNYWMTYATINQPFGLCVNPYLEAGVSYNAVQSDYWQMYRFGLAYGHGLPVLGGLYTLAEAKNDIGVTSSKRLIPVVAFAAGGEDIAFSYQHYHGARKASMTNLLQIMESGSDTLMNMDPSEIDSIVNHPSGHRVCMAMTGQDLTIFLHTGDTASLSYYAPCRGCVMPLPTIDLVDVRNMRIFGSHKEWNRIDFYDSSKDRISTIYGNLDNFLNQWQQSRRLIITAFPPDAVQYLRSISDWTSDHSFGVGQISHSNNF
jgi:hypothetical protein